MDSNRFNVPCTLRFGGDGGDLRTTVRAAVDLLEDPRTPPAVLLAADGSPVLRSPGMTLVEARALAARGAES